MSDESEGRPKREAGMDEILSSIKDIIAEDQAAKAPPAPERPAAAAGGVDDDALELTEFLEDMDEDSMPGADVLGLSQPPAAAAPRPPSAPPPAEGDPRARPAVVAQLRGLREAAVLAKEIGRDNRKESGQVSPAVMQAVTPLVEDWVRKQLSTLPEGSVADMARASVKDWLDTHLPEMVERVVREEVARMVDQASQD